MRKILLILLCLYSFNLFAQEYKICLAEFNNIEKAERQLKVLAENGIPAEIQVYNKSRGVTLFRILTLETMPNKQSAIFQKELLLNHPILRNLNINNISFVTVESKKNSNLINEQTQNDIQELQNELKKTKQELQETKGKLSQALSELKKNQNQKKVVKTPQKSIAKPVPKNRVISVNDSDTGKPVPNAEVKIDDIWNLQSDEEGKVILPEEVVDGEHKLIVAKDNEYVQTSDSFVVSEGEIISTPQISIPKFVDFRRIKIILDWGEFPWDLDAHVVDGTNHVFYSEKQQGNLELDRDDVDGFGPETVTIIEPQKDKVYSYYVYDCSNVGNNESKRLSNSKAQVKVYFDNEFIKSFNINPNKKGLTWHVFDIINGDEIVPKGKISAKKPTEY